MKALFTTVVWGSHLPRPLPKLAWGESYVAEAHAGLMHRELISHSIRLMADGGSDELWRAAEDAASRLAADVERRLAVADCLLAIEAPAAYEARWKRQAMFGHMSPEAAMLRRQLMGLARPSDTMQHAARWTGKSVINVLPALYFTRGG